MPAFRHRVHVADGILSAPAQCPTQMFPLSLRINNPIQVGLFCERMFGQGQSFGEANTRREPCSFRNQSPLFRGLQWSPHDTLGCPMQS